MKIKRTIDVTNNEFYDYLETELLNHISLSTDKSLAIEDIKKGVTYSNGKSGHEKIETTIHNYQRDAFYSATVKSFQDTNTITYTTKSMGEKLEIIYELEVESLKTSNSNKWLKLFSEGVYYGRMSDKLFEIEQQIHKLREQKYT